MASRSLGSKLNGNTTCCRPRLVVYSPRRDGRVVIQHRARSSDGQVMQTDGNICVVYPHAQTAPTVATADSAAEEYAVI